MERTCPASGQTGNRRNVGHEQIATPTTGTNETGLPGLCSAEAGVRLHRLAQPPQRQDASSSPCDGAEGGSAPYPLGLQDGGDADIRSGVSHSPGGQYANTTLVPPTSFNQGVAGRTVSFS